MSTPGAGGPQPPEQDPRQSGQPAGWGQQPPAGPPTGWGQQPPAGQPTGWGQPPAGQPQPGQQPQQPWGAPPAQPGQAPHQPWGGPQPPAGQPYPAQQPWGAAQPPVFGQPQQPEKPKRRWLPILGGVVGLLVVLIGLGSFLGAGDPEVGDCIHQVSATEYDTVGCDADNADFKIVGTDPDMTGEEFDATSSQELCRDFPTATSVLWYGADNAEDGHVYCAEDA